MWVEESRSIIAVRKLKKKEKELIMKATKPKKKKKKNNGQFKDKLRIYE